MQALWIISNTGYSLTFHIISGNVIDLRITYDIVLNGPELQALRFGSGHEDRRAGCRRHAVTMTGRRSAE
jgi:hypothetical protein